MKLRYTILFRSGGSMVWSRTEEDLGEALKVLAMALEDDGHSLAYRERMLSAEFEALLASRPGEHSFMTPDLTGSTIIKAHT